MRGLMVLSLLTLVYAVPQGYNFPNIPRQPHLQYGPAPGGTIDFLKDPQTVTTVQSENVNEQNFISANSISSNEIEQSSKVPQAHFESNAVGTNGLQSAYEPAPLQFTQQQQMMYAQAEPIISKRFYLHSAPEEDEEETQQRFLTVGKPRKNYNVVFIKSPTKSAQRASLKISPAVNEEKTVIYVLAKKQDSTDIDAQIHEPITTTTKPEVYFIKYKTHEEAEHAQRSIQAQYDALGGSTHISNEGIAPVSSVIGSLDEMKFAVETDAQYVDDAGAVGGVGAVDAVGDDVEARHEAIEEIVSSQSYQGQQLPMEQVLSTNNGYLPPANKYRL